MSVNTKVRTVAALAAVAGLSLTGVASAATVQRTGGPIAKPVVAGSTSVAVWAFPTGLKGSGTEAVCADWSDQLGEDRAAEGVAQEHNDLGAYLEAQAKLDEDTNGALDAGCVVIDEQ
jgi:hypothetical protein